MAWLNQMMVFYSARQLRNDLGTKSLGQHSNLHPNFIFDWIKAS
jgi:hypothetical protein